MKNLLMVIVPVVLALGCQDRRPAQVSPPGENGAEWWSLSAIASEAGATYRGIYLAEVTRSQIVTPEDAERRGIRPGRFVDVTLVELIAGGDTPWHGDVQPNVTVDVGRQIQVVLGINDAPCQGSRQAELAAGDRVIVFPSVLKSARYPSPDNTERTALFGGMLHSFVCVSSDGNKVRIEDSGSGASLDEVGDVELTQFVSFAKKYWAMEQSPMAEQVRTQCASRQCAAESSCFFGVGCAELAHQAPNGAALGFRTDGTNQRNRE